MDNITASDNTIISNSINESTTKNDILIINNLQDFVFIEEKYNELLNKVDSKNIFFQNDWLKSSWLWNEQQGVPNIICFYHKQELIAIIPIVIISKKNKSILQLLHNPFNPFNDILFDNKHASTVIKLLYKLITKWGEHWDELRFNNINENSSFLSLFKNQNRKNSPFKQNIKSSKTIYYIPIKELAHNWTNWLEQQSFLAKRYYNKVNKKYSNVLALTKDFSNTDSNNARQLKNLINIVDRRSQNFNVSSSQKLSAISLFLKRFCYYNNKYNWLQPYDWLQNNVYIASQYYINNCNNLYYMSTMKVSGQRRSAKCFLQALVLQDSLANNIEKIYFCSGMQSWQNLWHLKKERLYNIKIINKKSFL
jgi:hypothetical protein